MSKPTITEFLEARIAEDEIIYPAGEFAHASHAYDVFGTYNPHCPECIGIGDLRMKAECAAKRAIIDLADEALADEVERHDASALGARLMHGNVLCHLAAVYSSHPDYQPEWAPSA